MEIFFVDVNFVIIGVFLVLLWVKGEILDEVNFFVDIIFNDFVIYLYWSRGKVLYWVVILV